VALDPDTVLEERLSHEERACLALEAIGDALTGWLKLEQARFDKEYPVKTPRDAIVTTVPSDDDKLREDLGASDESLEEWQEIGPREQEVIVKEGKRPQVRTETKKHPPD
jgi:hypothetical protein